VPACRRRHSNRAPATQRERRVAAASGAAHLDGSSLQQVQVVLGGQNPSGARLVVALRARRAAAGVSTAAGARRARRRARAARRARTKAHLRVCALALGARRRRHRLLHDAARCVSRRGARQRACRLTGGGGARGRGSRRRRVRNPSEPLAPREPGARAFFLAPPPPPGLPSASPESALYTVGSWLSMVNSRALCVRLTDVRRRHREKGQGRRAPQACPARRCGAPRTSPSCQTWRRSRRRPP
jgi:hypothetical protein